MVGQALRAPGIPNRADALRLAMFGTYLLLLGLTISLVGAACGN